MKLLVTLVFILSLCFSCKDNTPQGPHEIYYGEDVCERCKMIISEEQYSSQYVLKDGTARKFDDLGCMLHYISHDEPGHGEKGDIESYYVKDYSTGEWIDGRSAYYVWSEGINTPMGYGIIAFKDQNSTKELTEAENAEGIGGFDEAAIKLQEQ